MSTGIDVGPLPPSAAEDDAEMSAISELINRVYRVAEEGLWLDGAARTTPAEVAAFTQAGEIAVARVAGQLAGSVRVRTLDDGLGEFGMLVSAPEHRAIGIGRELVRFAEARAGHAVMQLELLVPREWSHPSKEFLAGWYGRLGYRLVRVGTVEESHPSLAPLLATPCDVRIFHKDLREYPDR